MGRAGEKGQGVRARKTERVRGIYTEQQAMFNYSNLFIKLTQCT